MGSGSIAENSPLKLFMIEIGSKSATELFWLVNRISHKLSISGSTFNRFGMGLFTYVIPSESIHRAHYRESHESLLVVIMQTTYLFYLMINSK